MVKTVQTYSPKWYEVRETHLGASEISTLCGLSPFAEPGDVWKHKHDEPKHVDSSINTRVWWGHKEENAIIEAGAHERWGYGHEKMMVTGITWYQDGLMVSPDAVFTDEPSFKERVHTHKNSLIEAKTVGESMKPHWVDGPPLYVYMQVYAQMALMGSVDATIAARIAGAPVKIWTVEAAHKEAIKAVVARFWETTQEPDDWQNWVKDLMLDCGILREPKERIPKVLDLEGMLTVSEWKSAKTEALEAKKKADSLRSRVSDLFGEDSDMLVDGFGGVVLTSNTSKRTIIDMASLAEDYADLTEKYQTQKTWTTFKEEK